MPHTWSSEAVNRLKDQMDRKAVIVAAADLEEKIRTEQGTALWNEVRVHVQEKCDEFNEKLGHRALTLETAQPDQLHIRFAFAGHNRELHVLFNVSSAQDALSWTVSSGDGRDELKGRYLIGIDGGTAAFWRESITVDVPEVIAEKLLDALLPK